MYTIPYEYDIAILGHCGHSHSHKRWFFHQLQGRASGFGFELGLAGLKERLSLVADGSPTHIRSFIICHCKGVSRNGGTPKWLV